MKAFVCIIISLLTLSSGVCAQIVVSVEESISRNSNKNLAFALGSSVLFPGMGEYYLGEDRFLKAHIWADAALWVVALGSYFFGERQISTARSYASRYADIVSPPSDIDFLNLMADYRSRGGVYGENSNPDSDEDYNQAMLRAGRDIEDDYPYDESHTWDWGSSDNPANTAHMSHYRNILRNYRISRIAFQISIGALILNRVISIFEVLKIYRATSNDLAAGNLARVTVFPEFRPEGPGAKMFVNF